MKKKRKLDSYVQKTAKLKEKAGILEHTGNYNIYHQFKALKHLTSFINEFNKQLKKFHYNPVDPNNPAQKILNDTTKLLDSLEKNVSKSLNNEKFKNLDELFTKTKNTSIYKDAILQPEKLNKTSKENFVSNIIKNQPKKVAKIQEEKINSTKNMKQTKKI